MDERRPRRRRAGHRQGLGQKADRTILEKDTKTTRARRTALDAGTVAALRAWRAVLEHRAEIARNVLRRDRFVFGPTADGSAPWRSTGPARGGACGRRPGSIRPAASTTSATRLLDARVPVKTVSGRLGHARPATSLHVYAHFIPASDRLAADTVGQILSGGLPAALTSSPSPPDADEVDDLVAPLPDGTAG